jgi:hypothetical protein
MNGLKSSDGLGTVSRKKGLIVGAIASLVFIISVVAGAERIGTALALSVLVVSCVGIICWPLNNGMAFYLYVVAVSGVHLVASFAFADSVNGKVTYLLVPFIFVDIFVNVYLLKGICGYKTND